MNFRENMSRSKEVLGAYLRQGMHELGSIFYGHGTAAQHAEYGMLGTRTPGQVADGLRADRNATPVRDNTQPSQLQQHMEQIPEPEQSTPEVGMDIERE